MSNMEKRRILFQGDSITDGGRGRNEDPNHILGHGYAFIVAVKLGSEYPEKGFEFMNRGVSGDTTANLYARWQYDALNLKPDMISILVGINDVGQEFFSPPELVCDRFEITLKLILEQTKKILLETKLILMEPFMLDTGNLQRDEIVKKMKLVRNKQKIVKEIAREYGSVFVPLQEMFDEATKKQKAEYWIWDSIHPTYAGHGLIADAWLNVTSELLFSV